ncbi:MAG: phosphoribosyl-AMP cyclohydrolase [Spirochaetales bacterium]|nr:phosphoribosyl-AMP cyclohydrolase [Candidatus Physcosoma equi]
MEGLKLKYDDRGLIPAVVVDAVTKKVVMVAWMNEESLRITMEKKCACFYSRSRQELWLKGDTSGNYQRVVSITSDCDDDTLLVVVEPDGPACHTGSFSCFTHVLYENPDKTEFSLSSRFAKLRNVEYVVGRGLGKMKTEPSGEKQSRIRAAADEVEALLKKISSSDITLEELYKELSSRC